VSYIKYREPYSRAVINGVEVTFNIFNSWRETEESISLQAFKGFGEDVVMKTTIFLACEFQKTKKVK